MICSDCASSSYLLAIQLLRGYPFIVLIIFFIFVLKSFFLCVAVIISIHFCVILFFFKITFHNLLFHRIISFHAITPFAAVYNCLIGYDNAFLLLVHVNITLYGCYCVCVHD